MMEIRNRMPDVEKLRSHVCQDFLKMILRENWQEELYNIAKNKVETNDRYKDNYIEAYGKMRDVGPNNYSVDMMDVAFIHQIVIFVRQIINPVDYRTENALRRLNYDRRIKAHSAENEYPEELYKQCFLALCNLEEFVKAVDSDPNIDDEQRQKYRQKYYGEINELKSIIDEERIALVQRKKEIEKDIREITNSTNPDKKWGEKIQKYNYRVKDEDGRDRYMDFMISASDAGIKAAHYPAALASVIRNNALEIESRLQLLIQSYDKLSIERAKSIANIIYSYNENNSEITPGMKQIINDIISQGFIVEETATGYDIRES